MVPHLSRLFKKIRFQVSLGLVTTFAIVTIFPAVAQISHRPEWQNPGESLEQQAVAPATPAELLDRGRQLYENSRFREATEILRQAVVEFEQVGDRVGQARSLSSLSLAYQALSDWERGEGAVSRSLRLSQDLPAAEIRGQALAAQGYLQQERQETEAALASWQQAEATYREIGDRTGLANSQFNQVRALQALGRYNSAKQQLEAMYLELTEQPNSPSKAQGLHRIGILLSVIGPLQPRSRGKTIDSATALQQGLAVARQLEDFDRMSQILLSLGRAAQQSKQSAAALDYYQQAAKIAPHSQTRLQAQISQLSLAIAQQQWQRAVLLIPTIQSDLAALPASRHSVSLATQLIESLSQLGKNASPVYLETAAQIAANAVRQGQSLQDLKAEALALKALGAVYEQTEQYSEAVELTEQSQQIARKVEAREVEALAWWQLARLRRQLGNTPGAIAACRHAFNLLETLRHNFAIDPNTIPFFSQTLDPFYRWFVSLLLETPSNLRGELKDANLKALQESRQVVESLQQAELESFFHESILTGQPGSIEAVDPSAAILYPIILRDRLEVILSLPGQPPRRYATEIARSELETRLNQMRQSLRITVPRQDRLRLYQQAYDWLVRPARADLEQHNIKTLVFVLDSEFRRIPMAVLHDGTQYLIEQYGVAITQGLQLMRSPSLNSLQLEAITAGLSQARQGFAPLPGVETELTTIAKTINTHTILNQDFTNQNLQDTVRLTPTPIVHLATHGQFGSSAEDTFILTWDKKVNVKELDSLLTVRNRDDRPPVELLVLSACQTAKGDRRSLLGLAGMAVRSGARSTLATLWSVRDAPTAQLMAAFYQHLGQPGATKAEALRQAQLQLLRGQYKHPLYWAPFVLVGDWQ